MATRSTSILIVDDSPIILARLQNMLETLAPSVTILQARSSPEAISCLHKHPTRIILLDINLPGLNGIDLLRIIKQNFPPVIVIMLSNQSGEFYRSRCKTLGADYFIDKSTEFDHIPPIVLAHL